MMVTKRLVKLVFTLFGVVLWVVSVVSAVWVLCSPPEGPDGNLNWWQVSIVAPGLFLGAIGLAVGVGWFCETGFPAVKAWYDRLPDK